MPNKAWMTSAALIVCLLGVASCDDSADPGDDQSTTGSGDAAAETGGPPATEGPGAAMAEPDVADLPEVVAEVNGEEISREDFVTTYEGQFEQMAMQAQMTGQPVDQDLLKEQTVESMISSTLLVQESDERELTASDEEVDTILEELATGNGLGSTEELLAALQEQGLSEDDVRTEVETQVKVDKLIAEDGNVQEPTEEELRELYDTVAEQQGAAPGSGDADAGATSAPGGPPGSQLPPFEEVRAELAEQVRAEKESTAVQALIETLRAEADITVNL
ncbi:SurA N-terminal domain-containing protein [soil metagenome]|jgi:peptidyl-prolyl cis-trans isomerase SurA